MADIKWIKVAVDMFEDSKIEFIRSLPEGDAIIVIWLQLLSIAGKCNADGYLMVTDGIPYSEQMLSNTLRRNPVLMQFALESLIRLKMVNMEDGPFHITKWEKHQNAMRMEEIKSKSALKQAAYRERQKEKQLLLAESNEMVTESVTCYVTKSNSYQTELELDKDIDKDLKHIGDSGECATSFESFWKVYPNKKGKEVARKGWAKLWKSKRIDLEQVIAGTIAYAEHVKNKQISKPDFEYCYGSTFVNQQRWNDEWSISTVNGSSTIAREGKAARWEGQRRPEPNYNMPTFTQEQLDAMPPRG